jgi:hypothetical protein
MQIKWVMRATAALTLQILITTVSMTFALMHLIPFRETPTPLWVMPAVMPVSARETLTTIRIAMVPMQQPLRSTLGEIHFSESVPVQIPVTVILIVMEIVTELTPQGSNRTLVAANSVTPVLSVLRIPGVRTKKQKSGVRIQ